MYRLILITIVMCSLLVGIADAQTSAAAIAPANIVTDASGNLLLVERRAASSIPGAAPTATGLVTRIIIIPPQAGSSPSSAVYAGTMGNFYLGKRALYTIQTITEAGRATRALVAIDGGAAGVLPKPLPRAPITTGGTSDLRVIPANGNRDAIYVIQQPTIVRRTTGATATPAPTTNAPRTIVTVEFDGTSFSTPRPVTVQ